MKKLLSPDFPGFFCFSGNPQKFISSQPDAQFLMPGENKSTKCPNCEKEYDSRFAYCPWCGQENKPVDLSLKHALGEFIDANFNINSKAYITFKKLLFSPAFLTFEYLKGKHKKYLSPIRIYLIVSLIYFFLLSLSSPTSIKFNTNKSVSAARRESVKAGTKTEREATMEKYLNQRIDQLDTKQGKIAFINSLRNSVSKGMFLLMPLTALVFSVFYRHRRYFEHLIFIIHLQSVFFIVFTFYFLFRLGVNSHWGLLAEALLLFWISYLWAKRFYGKGIWATLWRLSLISLIMAGILFLFLLIVTLITLFLY